MRPSPPSLTDAQHRRLIWAATRAHLEADSYKHRRHGVRRRRRWTLFETLITVFGRLLEPTPLYARGRRNARRIVLRRVTLPFADLPVAFDGFRVLHLSDLHLDLVPGTDRRIESCLRGVEADLCVLTGDYRHSTAGGCKAILPAMRRVVEAAACRYGIVGILGNHDSHLMVEPFEAMGIRMLVNETWTLEREAQAIHVTGLDDPCYYYTDQCIAAMERSPPGFKLALVHAPSLFDIAAANGYRLYLCGHTHGGQICLPGGIPLILHLRHGRRYYRGRWRYGSMVGYTSQGAGTVGIPLRFNTESEIALIQLRRGGTGG